jgi:membrane protein
MDSQVPSDARMNGRVQARHQTEPAERLLNFKRAVALRRKTIAELIKQSVKEWNTDNAPRLSAALAFYTLLSLSPMVIVMISVAGFAFGQAAAGGQLAREIHNVVGWDGATAIQVVIQAAQRPHTSIVAALLSVFMLGFGASSVMVELRSGLNTIWRVPNDPCSFGLKAILRIGKERLYSFVLVAGGGFLLLISLAVSAWVTGAGRLLGPRLAIPESRLHEATFAASYLMITVLFAAVYRTLPDAKLQWRDVAVGACITSLIFSAGKQIIAFYLIKASFASKPVSLLCMGRLVRLWSCWYGYTTLRNYSSWAPNSRRSMLERTDLTADSQGTMTSLLQRLGRNRAYRCSERRRERRPTRSPAISLKPSMAAKFEKHGMRASVQAIAVNGLRRTGSPSRQRSVCRM